MLLDFRSGRKNVPHTTAKVKRIIVSKVYYRVSRLGGNYEIVIEKVQFLTSLYEIN